MSKPREITFLSNDSFQITYYRSFFKMPLGAFELRVVHDAKVILEETDSEKCVTGLPSKERTWEEIVLDQVRRTAFDMLY